MVVNANEKGLRRSVQRNGSQSRGHATLPVESRPELKEAFEPNTHAIQRCRGAFDFDGSGAHLANKTALLFHPI